MQGVDRLQVLLNGGAEEGATSEVGSPTAESQFGGGEKIPVVVEEPMGVGKVNELPLRCGEGVEGGKPSQKAEEVGGGSRGAASVDSLDNSLIIALEPNAGPPFGGRCHDHGKELLPLDISLRRGGGGGGGSLKVNTVADSDGGVGGELERGGSDPGCPLQEADPVPNERKLSPPGLGLPNDAMRVTRCQRLSTE
ncbi:hypothetical protein BC829DRAFT_423587 [Chytridium lagenaria]|nr:hypothetical protein BC829DRAFT_423587 [Chytridium lagenaria]